MPSEKCECGNSRVACFDIAQEREHIVKAVWGNHEERSALRHFVERRARRATSASLAGMLTGAGVTLALVGVGPAMGLLGTLGGLAGGAVATHRNRLGRFNPKGAKVAPASRAMGLRTKIRGTHILDSPAGTHACLAFMLELRISRAGQESIAYRDAVTSGFSAELGTGEVLEVPAGRLRFGGRAEEIVDFDNLKLEEYLTQVDPRRSVTESLDPLHYNIVREEVLFDGDEVYLQGSFEPVVERSGASLYRESPRTHLCPRGIVQVHRAR